MAEEFSKIIKHSIGYILLVNLFNYCLICDRMWFMPTCPVFAGPVTYNIIITIG